MNKEIARQQRLRFLAGGLVTLFLVTVITRALMMIAADWERLLWGVPVIAVSLLDIYFLTRSLLRQPKSIDTRLSTFIISLGATFGFSVVAMLFIDTAGGSGTWQDAGRIMSLLPYPLVLWALLCLKDCLTVVPEAHTVVAHGIYKYSRHPLYVCYIIWAAANVLMYPFWPMLAASVLQVSFLVIRLRREEQLLLAAFPEYRDYYLSTGWCGPLGKGR